MHVSGPEGGTPQFPVHCSPGQRTGHAPNKLYAVAAWASAPASSAGRVNMDS
jgi:hypothetical protein